MLTAYNIGIADELERVVRTVCVTVVHLRETRIRVYPVPAIRNRERFRAVEILHVRERKLPAIGRERGHGGGNRVAVADERQVPLVIGACHEILQEIRPVGGHHARLFRVVRFGSGLVIKDYVAGGHHHPAQLGGSGGDVVRVQRDRRHAGRRIRQIIDLHIVQGTAVAVIAHARCCKSQLDEGQARGKQQGIGPEGAGDIRIGA